MLENFIWLFKWYASQCDHYWEEWYGIVLETTESSGWSLSICIEETELENVHFQNIYDYIDNNDWFECSIKSKKFIGNCSVSNINKLLSVFRKWAESSGVKVLDNIVIHNCEDKHIFSQLMNWYAELCSSKLGCKRRIMISTLENPGWDLHIDLHGTNLENKTLKRVCVDRTEDDWYQSFTKDGFYNGPCGLYNFFEVLAVFNHFYERRDGCQV